MFHILILNKMQNISIASTQYLTCETENPTYKFAEFPCKYWRNCEYECYSRYRYPLESCAELIQNCPLCCSRSESVHWVWFPFYYLLFLFALLFVVSISVRYTTDAYRDGAGIVHIWPWLWLWSLSFRGGVRGR